MLTHGHEDHYGGAAEVRSWVGATVYAHAADAAVVRGEAARAEPVLTEFDRPIWEQVSGGVMLGVFNLDGAAMGFHRLAALETDTACFGHGAPLLDDPGPVLRRAAANLQPRHPLRAG